MPPPRSTNCWRIKLIHAKTQVLVVSRDPQSKTHIANTIIKIVKIK